MPYLVCDAMEQAGLVHGFFLRHGGVSQGELASLNLGNRVGDAPENVCQNHARMMAALVGGGEPPVVHKTSQVHGTVVLEACEGTVRGAVPVRQADGLWTGAAGQALEIHVADCAAVLVVDPVGRRFANLHAGWRGAVGGIVARGIECLCGQGSRTSDLLVAVGPCIGGCCYEVSRDVAQQFDPRAVSEREGMVFADIAKQNALVAVECGVRECNIYLANMCTSCNVNACFSHRAQQGRAGRMAAVGWFVE